ncbi:hypothetical protein A2415_05435 [candidate division WWE3 bacterium RIFOXYC1_FULL_39_7]|uniref:Glycosyltransferase RgtA/B/C/D-like domain-containing protein n=2 Tax=Katanobacteria TaxID=422282 RepID=A0A1F4X9S9_UNCKA|nr:MAG: hypothetical protein A2415_05435 [candidate division WWE3 bacterium RIFOXYC1_FULL_39_7]OGC78418.1 MAG: hypothetical protein A2619_00955 [candidate division WWE3 bacterium RIFOXYD1_FULL_39_9]
MINSKRKNILLFLSLLLLGLGLRLYHIEFGLPHSFYADEPEFSELAIKYTYEIKDIVRNNDYYKLIPISYVYGTFPTYLLTVLVMGFSKINNLFNLPFDKTSLFIFQRVITAFISLLVVVATGYIYKVRFSTARGIKFSENRGLFIAVLLAALNWKLIAHAHYVNADIFITLLICLSIGFLLQYHKTTGSKYLILSAVFFGLAVGTKVTALMTLPFHLWLIADRKDLKGFLAYCFIILGTFAITNPFSIIFSGDFITRVLSLATKEAGMVFDSVDLSYTKYVAALAYIATPFVFMISLYGMWRSSKFSGEKKLDMFLLSYVATYLLFFTLQSRRVDRWVLPVLPIILVYAAYTIDQIFALTRSKFKPILLLVLVATLLYYVFFTGTLLSQFRRDTPKSEAYLWAKANLPELSTKLAYTEEGLDPLNKLPFATVIKFKVYASENAQFFTPENPELYDYVIISSRPMENYKREEVKTKYPFYYKKWAAFEEVLMDPTKFELIKDFTLNKPNLIPLSDVYIYKNL